MAKTKQDKKLYNRMRDSGVRKSVARRFSELPASTGGGKKTAPKPLREAIDRLESAVDELRDHTGRGQRSASARKAARTRSSKATARSASARKGARGRGKAKSKAS